MSIFLRKKAAGKLIIMSLLCLMLFMAIVLKNGGHVTTTTSNPLTNYNNTTSIVSTINYEGIVTLQDMEEAMELYTTNSFPFPFIANPISRCQISPFLTMITPSSPEEFVAREFARKYRGNVQDVLQHEIIHLFIIGKPTENKNVVTAKLLNESHSYGDIILIDVLDSYKNLTLKTIMMLKWISNYCSRTKYLLKVDNDVLVNLINLIRLLESAPSSSFVTGKVSEHPFAFRRLTVKNPVTKEEWPLTNYPPVAVGTSYVISGDVVKKLYQASLYTKLLNIEDVYVGILLSVIGVRPQHNEGFRVPAERACLPKCCRYDAITYHFDGSDNLIEHYREVKLLNLTGHCM
ncbi:beta-1,3-galactosyltransferase 1-like [Saccoglossus kowalevskii]|uniref:Hexosyltransferase n=1 Tax=Saccoglossus kowalevskii TaxID=10224 RepID=A0ABM0MCK3_SACKO|nr:PREDICTED: beta-1,3-galactosyltransferase 1-like [Saccoglossus kowalevskii]